MKLAAVALAAALCCGTAEAAFPGANGRIVFTQDLPPFFDSSVGNASFLCATSPEGSGFQRLAAVPPDAAWAPDGRIAYGEDGEVVVAGPNGEASRAVAAGTQPSWSPDGRRIVFVASRRGGVSVLAIVSDDGSGLHLLPSAARRVAAPAWSPTGGEIAFVGFGDADGWSLRLLSPDGSRERVLGPAGADSQVDWSPDGTRLLLADGAGGTDLVDAFDGGTRFHFRGAAAWSPDGAKIAVVDGKSFVLWRADLDDSRWLADLDDTWNGAPRWLTTAQDRSTGSGSCDTPIYRSGPAEGTDGPDTFLVSAKSVQLTAFAGDDVLYAPRGTWDDEADSFDMGAGDDVVFVERSRGLVALGPGDDFFHAQDGADSAGEGFGPDVVYGGTGDDHLRGGPDDDRLYGDRGDDRIQGSFGANRLYGGAGDDSVTGLNSEDAQVLDGGPGRDTIVGGAGSDRIRARDGYADRIDCKGGRDVVYADRYDSWGRNCERVVVE